MKITLHEKTEFARFGLAAFEQGYESIGNQYRAASALETLSIREFDILKYCYRRWLIANEFINPACI